MVATDPTQIKPRLALVSATFTLARAFAMPEWVDVLTAEKMMKYEGGGDIRYIIPRFALHCTTSGIAEAYPIAPYYMRAMQELGYNMEWS